MLELYINKDLEQLDVNSNIKIKLEYNTELMLEITQERVKTKMVSKLKGWPKGLKNKVYTLNPEFNKETQQSKLKLSFNSKPNTAFYIAYAASLMSLIYNNLKTIKEAKSRLN